MPTFSTRDPAAAAFWDERFAADYTPWDAGRVPPAFLRWLAALGPGAGRRVLVPGCGSAYEVAALDAAGFHVLAVDYAAAAVARARAVLGAELADRTLRQADVFALGAAAADVPTLDVPAADVPAPGLVSSDPPSFDLVYERAFLAALPPALWPQWAAAMLRLTAPGGELAGFFFLAGEAPAPRRGPPFALLRAELDALLDPGFACIESVQVPAAESLEVFAGRECWLRWRRR